MSFSAAASDKRVLAGFLGFSAILLLALGLAIYRQNVYFLTFPLILVILGVIFTQYRALYYLLLAAIPFSVEINLPGGFSTDLVSEPLMILLAGGCLGAWVLGYHPDLFFLKHPLVKLIIALFGWAVFVSIFSVDALKSWKYVAAKSWYLLVFVFLTAALLRTPAAIRRVLSIFGGALALAVGYVLIRHGQAGFMFDSANAVVRPFFRNHVMYGVTAAATLPYGIYLFVRYQGKRVVKTGLGLGCALLLAAVVFSYTRASWLSLPLALLYYFFIRSRLTRYFLIFGLAGALAGGVYLGIDYRYLQYAPDYEKTIFNEGDLANHLRATYTWRDVSGMERIYRWLAAVRMVADRPLTGSGPSTFYPEYRRYTVSRFVTYVSDNPEKSTVHNYFLLQFAEQGLPGGILFLLLMGYALTLPEKLYHRAHRPEHKNLALAAGLCLFIIAVHLVLNELLETDKIGSLFYISLVVLIRLDDWTKAAE